MGTFTDNHYKLYTNPALTSGITLSPAGVLDYVSNVEGSYDSRSLTDKHYVDSVSSAAATSAIFDDTLTANLYTNGHLVSADGTTGILMKDNGLLMDTGTISSGSSLTVSGAGTRMFWYPKKGAFRAGTATGTVWDDSNLGINSAVFGYGNIGSGRYSLACGVSNTASDDGALVYGAQNSASGTYSFTGGKNNGATGYSTVALGYNCYASGTEAVALGTNNTANGNYSVAIGSFLNTNNLSGSMIFGDSTTTTTYNDQANQMMMRFVGGYKLYSNSAKTAGLQLTSTGGSNLGISNTVSGTNATAIGNTNTASSTNAVAIGNHLTASGASSVALGSYVSTNSKGGSVIVGDSTSTTTSNDANNQMMMRFTGGYKLYSNSGLTAGLQLTTTGGSNLGISNTVSGTDASAIGNTNTASNTNSVAIGNNNTASSTSAVALGNHLTASGASSVALGSYVSTNSKGGSVIVGDSTSTTTSNDANNQMMMRFTGGYKLYSNSGLTAGLQLTTSGGTNMGVSNTVSGTNAVGAGNTVTASATNAIAMGNNVTASGVSSVAIGSYVSTNSKAGSMILGDSSTTTATTSSTTNQMTMRFANGYKLYTNAAASVGAQIAAGGNSWSTISDRRKKENFATVDGNELLGKIAKMPLSSWNYIGQDPKTFRHYGPMAQDFYAAFGHDKYGTSGNDTTINQADMEGVSFIAIQALEKRTEELTKENSDLKAELEQLKNNYAARLERLEAAMNKAQDKAPAQQVK